MWLMVAVGVVALLVGGAAGWFGRVLLERLRPDAQLRRAARMARQDCAQGRHEWQTPWVRSEVQSAVYAGDDSTRPIKRLRTYSTSCRQCGVPTSRRIDD